MPKLKTASWDATVELDKRVWLLVQQISEQYGVRVKLDSNYDKGTIRINVK